jgi:hypothetical protein
MPYTAIAYIQLFILPHQLRVMNLFLKLIRVYLRPARFSIGNFVRNIFRRFLRHFRFSRICGLPDLRPFRVHWHLIRLIGHCFLLRHILLTIKPIIGFRKDLVFVKISLAFMKCLITFAVYYHTNTLNHDSNK